MGAQHPVRALENLAKQIALPAEHAPQRFPSFPALERTAVMGFTQPATIDVPVSTDTKVVITRQATYPVWGQVTTNADTYCAQWSSAFPQITQASGGRDLQVLSQLNFTGTGNRTASVTVPGVVGAGGSTYAWPILGEDYLVDPNPYIYIPDNWNLYAVVNFTSVTPASGSSMVTMEEWSSPGQNKNLNLPASFSSGVTGGMSLPSTSAAGGRWVRPVNIDFAAGTVWAAPNIPTVTVTLFAVAGTQTYTTSAVNAGTVTITGTTSRALMPLVYPTEFVNSQLPWMSTRLTAVAALFTNVTQVLNKGGTVLAGRVNPATFNPFAVQKSVINTLHPAEKAFLPLETGLYTYAPPSTDMSEFWDYVSNTANGAAAAPVYRLDNSAMVNVAFFTPGSVAEALAINASWHMEFRTSSALFQVGMSGLTLESLHQAQLGLSRVGFFFENPNHVEILRRVISAVRMLTGPVMAGFKGAYKYSVKQEAGKKKKGKAPRPRRPAATRVVFYPRPGPTRVPPTSGQRSGITGGRKKMASGLDLALAKYGMKR